MINLYCGDNLEAMKKMKDNQYDLAIIDPPYGLPKGSSNGAGKMKDRVFNRTDIVSWDIAPTKEFFDELFRVSKNQIIWGGNYFDLPPTRCIICWDKVQPWENFSQIEMAWTSFNKPAKLFKFDNRTGGKIHPTQKPIELYTWTLDKFATEGDKILDTNLGSGSIAIACYQKGYSLDAWEISKEYYDKALERFNTEKLSCVSDNQVKKFFEE